MTAEISTQDLFVIETPLGFTVRVSARYWATIVAKHQTSQTASPTYKQPYGNRRRYDRAVGTPRSSCSTAPATNIGGGL
jgi:hypothetical protein